MTQIHPMTDFWDDAFVREIEGTTVDQGVLIWALSGPSFVLRTPQSLLYIDPFLGGDFAGAPAGMYRTTADTDRSSEDQGRRCGADDPQPL